jgi:hypothetical protein
MKVARPVREEAVGKRTSLTLAPRLTTHLTLERRSEEWRQRAPSAVS